METPVTYTTTLDGFATTTLTNVAPGIGLADLAAEDHLTTAAELIADLENDAPATPSYWLEAAKAHALISIAQSLRQLVEHTENIDHHTASLARYGISIQSA